MRNLVIALSALAIMMLGIYGSVVILFDQDRIKSMISDQVEQRVGRRVEIHGEVRLRMFPGLRISAEQVVMSGPEQFEGPDLFQADQLDAQVRLLPLIRGRVDPSIIRINGIRLNLLEDSDGVNSLDGLLNLVGSESPDRSETGATVSLENIVVSTGRDGQDLRESLELERMDVDGFALGQPLQFRFRGSLGEPALFDYLEVDGLLVSPEADRLRLSNMRMAGVVDQGHYDLEMLGNVSISMNDRLSFSLDGGKLNFNDHQFDMNLRYGGADRPSFSARLSAGLIDVDVLQVLERVAMVPELPDDSGAKTAMRGMDFDVDLDIEQIATLGMVVDGMVMRVTGRDGLVQIQSVEGRVPGAGVTGSAELDLRFPESDWQVGLQLDVMEMASLLEAMRLDGSLEGAGPVTMNMQSSINPETGQGIWTGTAQVEMVDGAWPLIGKLTRGLSDLQSDDRFEFLTMKVAIDEERMHLADLHLFTADLELGGDLTMSLADGELDGWMNLETELGVVQVQLGGTLEQLEAVYGPLVARQVQ